MNNTLTRIEGIRVGHVTDSDGATGCTVIICPPHTVGAVDVRGGAPGTRETDLLQPHNRVEEVTAVMLSGGSAFGLGTADGAMRWLDERQIGYKSGAGYIVPIVPAAILFDLTIGKQGIRPTAEMGYLACENANSDPVPQGSVGAGTGASVGKMSGTDRASKGGIGSASIELDNGLVVAALMAVNAVGDVIDEHGQILAGIRAENGTGFVPSLDIMTAMFNTQSKADARENTVIGVVATNAKLSKPHTHKVAQMAHDGIARAVNPSHTMFDGDTIFALSTGEIPSHPTLIGAYAAEVVATAIRNAVIHATTLGGVRAINESES